MIEINKAYEDLGLLSAGIGAQVRAISMSLIAVIWLLLFGGNEQSVLPAMPNKNFLIAVGSLALASLFLDYLQALVGYWSTLKVVKAAEAAKSKHVVFNPNDCLYALRSFLFYLKQMTLVIAVFLLVYTIGSVLI